MLIKIEKASTSEGWNVWIDAWRVEFCSYAQALAFVNRLECRINSPHPLPVSVDKLELELS
ncbi:hypothetical protein D9M71_729800 [compost metagenome]|jgi:hypothetical protein